MKIQFEESRKHIPVPPGSHYWECDLGRRIPLCYMADSYLQNCRNWLVKRGKQEVADCEVRCSAVRADRNVSSAMERVFMADSARRLKYMDMWYDRLTEEKEKRKDAEEKDRNGLTGDDGEAPNDQRLKRNRGNGVVSRVRHYLHAAKGGTRNR